MRNPETSNFARLSNGVIIAAATGSMIFEQTPANEAWRTNIASDLLQNGESAVAVGLAVGAATVAIEGISSALVSVGLNRDTGFLARWKRKQEEKLKNAEVSEKRGGKVAKIGADVALALGIGAGFVTIKHHIQDPEPTLSKDLKTSAKATGIVASVSGTIGYLFGGGINQIDKLGHAWLTTGAEKFVQYGADTKFWLGAFAVGYGAKFAKDGTNKLRKSRLDRLTNQEVIS
ncbi:MAG: hypothetical protein M3P98_00240 [bacterium]|nr:hypothetical protein [bacterium]